MNNYLAMNICEAIMPIKDDSVNVTIVTNSGNVYNNVEVNLLCLSLVEQL